MIDNINTRDLLRHSYFINERMRENFGVIKYGVYDYNTFANRIKIGSPHDVTKKQGHFTLSIRGKELEAYIKLNKNINGTRRDVMVIKNGEKRKNDIILELKRKNKEGFTPEDIKKTLYDIARGKEGYAQYRKDGGLNEESRNEIIVDLQDLFITFVDKWRYNTMYRPGLRREPIEIGNLGR